MKRGFFVGLWLTVTRILRCNPFCAAGYDPVPEKKPKRIPKYQRDEGKDKATNDTTPSKREEK
jgi:putative component of membrane protein insertase Oxa1/YidC/SpoIIIJ protein YidD